MKSIKTPASLICLLFFSISVLAQKTSLVYTVKMDNPGLHFLHVQLSCKGVKKDFIDFKKPVWTPGYYQKMDYGKNLEQLKATDETGKELKWEKINDNTWRVPSKNSNTVNLSYEIKTVRSFVATAYLDETRAYILPAAVFLYIDKMINQPVQVTVVPDSKWRNVATGLDSIAGKKFTYSAPDFDILYDSPILVGDLEELTPFKIQGITHRFIGFKPGDFDKQQFMLISKKLLKLL